MTTKAVVVPEVTRVGVVEVHSHFTTVEMVRAGHYDFCSSPFNDTVFPVTHRGSYPIYLANFPRMTVSTPQVEQAIEFMKTLQSAHLEHFLAFAVDPKYRDLQREGLIVCLRRYATWVPCLVDDETAGRGILSRPYADNWSDEDAVCQFLLIDK